MLATRPKATPHTLDVAIGHRIRERRQARRLSQQQLADAIGVTFQQVQKYERGSNRVSFSRLLLIAQALDCRLADLAEGLDAETAEAQAGLNELLATDGALELLQAYKALPGRELRRALLLHARTLAGLYREPPTG